MTRQLLNIADMRDHAKSRLPKGLFDFIDRGTEDDVAVRDNRSALARYKLRPRVLVDVSKRRQDVEIFGRTIPSPFGVAPMGAAGLLWHDGELALAQAAADGGVPFALSTASTTAMEVIAERAGGRRWFQLYMWPDRALSVNLVKRAAAAGFEALLVTVDTVTTPNREYNKRNGFALPFRVNRRNFVDIARHPRWLVGVMGRYAASGGMPRFENYPDEMRQSVTARIAPSLPKNDSVTWDDLRRLRDVWRGPLIVKGVLHPEDAALAVACGADGIIVSNHGGRNLDCSLAPADALPAIAARVGGQTTIILDGAISRGSDVVKALALGAQMVLLGRAPMWGVASGGRAGAVRALELMREEIDRVMALTGCATVADIGPDLLHRNGDPLVDAAAGAPRAGPVPSSANRRPMSVGV